MIRKLRITVEGKAYEVTVEVLDGQTQGVAAAPQASVAPATSAAATPPPAAAPAPKPAASGGGAGAVPSPLAGKVVSIDVKEGAQVTEGQQIVTLEAMKMNTFVNAPASGTVKGIAVEAGDSVEEGQTLLTIE